MPLSLLTAAQFCNVDPFLSWDPATDTFGPSPAGRLRHLSGVSSPGDKADRRTNAFFLPGALPQGVSVLLHTPTDMEYLVGMLPEQETWQGVGVYQEMRRMHRAVAPTGGKGEHVSVAVAGTGDDLGPVVLSAPVPAYLDVERNASTGPAGTLQAIEGEAVVYCSSNLVPAPGDFLRLQSTYYRADEWFYDSGFLCAKVVLAPPQYTTVTFSFPGAGAPVFDPATGGFTTGSWEQRQVSALVDAYQTSGRPSDGRLDEVRTLYIFSHHIGFTPELGQLVEISGRQHRVVDVSIGVTDLQWKVEVRP